jgi:glycosyltransferase involved in cell wall biosynthesis
MNKILFFLHKTGPYHHARFCELAKHCTLTVVEILPESKEYEWNKIKEDRLYQTIQIIAHKDGIEQKGEILKKWVKEIFDQIHPDLCMVTGWNNRTYFAALWESKKRRIPIACISDSTYNDTKRIWIKEKIKSILIQPFDAFLVAGTLSRDYLLRLHIKSPIFMPWDVVDNNLFNRTKPSPSIHDLPESYLLCVARYIWEKNISELILGFDKFMKDNSESSLHLVIIGSGPLKQEVASLIDKLLCKNVLLIPFLQYDELPEIYSKAKAFILPSVKDTWGLVVNEAMAAGLPVIVSERCGCVPDLVQQGVNGYICQPDCESIADTISRIGKLSETALHTMGNAGKEIIKNYCLERFSQAVENIYGYGSGKKFQKMNILVRLLTEIKIYL